MKKIGVSLLVLLLVFTVLNPYSTLAKTGTEDELQEIANLMGIEIISSEENGSVYRLKSEDGIVYEYDEKVVSSKNKDIITTKIYVVEGDEKKLVDQFTTHIEEDETNITISNSKKEELYAINLSSMTNYELIEEKESDNVLNTQLGVWYGSRILSGSLDVKYKL
uniref:hypothetical protein n=1 Tax=Caldalkalibacillus mannanilyticus TaxID=1418 RepID=UPI00054D2A76